MSSRIAELIVLIRECKTCRHLRSLLSSISPHRQEETQTRLIFETQLAFVVECADLFVTEVIHRKGRIQQSMNARRQKVENQIRKEEFAERLYVAIGFLGGNFRYRDSERFWNIRYFIHRYLTEKCLRLELKFIQRCMEKLTGMAKQFDQTFLNLNFESF